MALENPTQNREINGVRYQVRTELMEDYASVEPINGQNSHLLSCQDAEGDVQFVSLGTDREIYILSPASDTQSGWKAIPLNFPFEVECFAIGRERTGASVVLACGANSYLYWMSDEAWSSWQLLGKPFGNLDVSKLRAGYDSKGGLVFQALVSLGPDGPSQGVVSVDPRNHEIPWDYVSDWIDGVVWDFLPGTAAQGSIEDGTTVVELPTSGCYLSSHDNSRKDDNVAYFGDHEQRLRTFFSSSSESIFRIFGVPNKDYASDVFFLSEEGKASYLELDEDSGENLTDLSVSASGEALTYETLAVARSRRTTSEGSDVLVFFGLTKDGRLFHCARQVGGEGDIASAEPGWSSLVMIGDGLVVSANSLTVCQNGQGFARGFAVMEVGGLTSFLQDANGNWQFSPVTLPDLEGDAVSYPCYTTEVTVLDDQEQAVPGCLLNIAASDYQDVEINGKKTQIGPQKSFPCATNSSGRVTITSATASLGNANYRVTTSLVDDLDSALVISPSRYIQDTLCPIPDDPISGVEALEATLESATYTDQNGNEQPLLTSTTDLESVSNAIWHGMSLAQVSDGDLDLLQVQLARGGDRAGVQIRRDGRFATRIEPSKLRPQFWAIRFGDEGPKFQALDGPAGASAVINSFQVSPSNFSLSSLRLPSWGDLWRGLKSDISALDTIVVETVSSVESALGEVVSEVRATISVIVDGVLQVLEYVVDTVEQAFDMVEGVFEAIAVGFDKLHGWLATLFAWDDILSVHNAINDLFQTFFSETLPAQIVEAKENTDSFFNDLEAKINDAIQGVGEVGDESVNSTLQEARSDDPQVPGPSANWTENQVLNSGGGATKPSDDETDEDDLSPIEQFEQTALNDLKGFADTISSSLTTAIAQGKSIDNITPVQVFEIAGLTLAEDFTAGVQLALDAAFDISDFLVQQIGELGAKEWEIPVLTKVYKKLTGNPMTVFDVVALGIAMPTTPTLKILDTITGKDSIQLLGKYSSIQRLGVGKSSSKNASDLAESDSLDTSDLQAISYALGACYGFGQLLYSPFSTMRALGELESKVLDLFEAIIGGAGQAFSFPLLPGQLDGFSEEEILPTASVWSLNSTLWLFCDAFPAIVAYLPDSIKTTKPDPERQPLLGGSGAEEAEEEILSYITDVLNCAGGLILGVGYGVQTATELLPNSPYLKGEPTDVRLLDIGVKLAQNIFGVLPRFLAPLNWPPFEPYGKPTLGLLAFGGSAGTGGLSVIRTFESANNKNFHHVI